jgi:hypothetical protein
VKWHHFRQHGFLTLAIVLGVASLLELVIPVLDLRGAIVLIAVVALVLGWRP